MVLINLYGGYHGEVEVIHTPGHLRFFWYPRDRLDRYPAGAALSHPGDHGGYSPHGDDEGFSYQGRAGPVAVPCSLLRRSLDAAASLQAAFQDR